MSEYPRGALAALAAEHGLTRVGVRPRFGDYVRQTWQRRHFMVTLASSKAYQRNQGGYLGQLWAVITPVLWACVYLFVFGELLRTDRGIANYTGFLVVGVFLFHFSTASISNGSKSLTLNQELMGSLQFPRALLPMAAVTAELFTLLPTLAVMVGVIAFSGEPVAWSWALLPVAVVLQWVFGVGVALIFARLVAQVRDVARLVPFVLRALMYTSGVFFSLDHYVHDPGTAAILGHQPIAIYLELARGALLQEFTVTASTWAWAIGWAAGAIAFGIWFFWRAEEKYARG